MEYPRINLNFVLNCQYIHCSVKKEIINKLPTFFKSNYQNLKMEKSLAQQTTELIARDFGLETGPEPLTEQELFDLVANEVAYMIEHRLESLFSLLYRLDVSEKKIRSGLAGDAAQPANITLAQLIIDRQKQRIFTKQKYRQEKLDDLGDLEY